MKIISTDFKDCFILEPDIYEDDRGLFFEGFNKKKFEKLSNQKTNFIQDNYSFSKKGVLRGLHFQTGKYSQAKLVQVISGKVIDVVVDLRKESLTYGKHIKTILSSKERNMIFIPKGMAHGFISLEETIFTYKCNNYYNKNSESGIIYNDPNLNIDWEFDKKKIIVSNKDLLLPNFN